MGTSDSSCCGSKSGPPKPDMEGTSNAFKKQRVIKSYRDTEPFLNGQNSELTDGEAKITSDHQKIHIEKKEAVRVTVEAKCITTKDILQCEPLQRIVTVMDTFNKWLESKSFLDWKQLRAIDNESTDYHQYDEDMKQLIMSIDGYSMQLFLTDSSHIKHKHYDQYDEIRRFCIDELNEEYRRVSTTCLNDNCFSMKHFYLRNKSKERYDRANPLEMLTNLHIYLFHSIYISELKIQHVHPRCCYVIATFIEQTQRTLNIKVYPTDIIPCRVVHLVSLYYDGKRIDADDALDTISPLRLAQFTETMDEKQFDSLWSRLDRDGSNTIDTTEIDIVLLMFHCVLIKIVHKESGQGGKLQVDTASLRLSIEPIATWMKRDKMSEHPEIEKDEFKETLSAWLREYHITKGGIIADEKMQKQILNKYKVDQHQNSNDYDRLVVNCEYLEEHKSVCISEQQSNDEANLSIESCPIVVCGPSGVGKGTLLNRVGELLPDTFGVACSHTTRAARQGEIDGVNYHFITKEAFKASIANGAFVEYAEVNGHYYGTSYEGIEEQAKNNLICILEIDVQGANIIQSTGKLKANYLFITCDGGIDTLKKRLMGRNTETEEEIQKRLHTANKELQFLADKQGFFGCVISNDDLDDSVQRLIQQLKTWYPWLMTDNLGNEKNDH